MFAAQIQNGLVVQVSRAADGQALPDGWVASETRVGIGWSYDGEAFAPPPPNDPPDMEPIVRERRDLLLARSDWTQLPDAPVDVAAWATYRQALRDVPQQDGFPASVAWPTQPGGAD